MPELPEVETIRRGLNKKTQGQTIRGGQVLLDRTIAYPLSIEQFWQGLEGATIEHWQRRGKYLLAKLEIPKCKTAGWLGIHLRMTGQLLWLQQDVPLQKHVRLRFFFADDWELRFNDIRTFGKVWYVPPSIASETIITGLKTLGPEPFSAAFSLEYLTQQCQKRHRPIKSLLMEQSLVAGVGNIYADEALFRSHIHPEKPANQVNEKEIAQLRQAVIEVLEIGIQEGGTTFSDFRGVTGINGNYIGVAWVYGREGQPCRICNTPIERIKLAGRSAHFCPRCQQ